MISMPDYKEMYLKLFRATENAMRILEEAQLECEEMYISSPEPEIRLLEDLTDSDTASDTAK